MSGPGRGTDSVIRIRLQELKNKLCCITDSVTNLEATFTTLLSPQARIPNAERVTGAWTNSEITFSFSVANVGTGNGTVLGTTIKPGEIVNYDASAMNNYFAENSITASGAGTELLISWITA
jgi:hypothetical protein